MNLDDWRQVQAAEPATPNQVGAIRGRFERLGFGPADRAERLAICAALLGLDGLGSTADLSMGQAGQLYRQLLGITSRAGLLAATALGGQGHAPEATAPGTRMTIAEVIRELIIQLHAITAGAGMPGRPAGPPPASRTAGR